LAFGDLLSLGIAQLAIHIIFQLRKPLGNDQENIQDFLANKKMYPKIRRDISNNSPGSDKCSWIFNSYALLFHKLSHYINGYHF